ncbi:MAG: hypothetical protein QOI35_2012 [Cryptosporangiaceae bacterium]|nr:hypothetical protein [Cryptosporangiaceae bacterium]
MTEIDTDVLVAGAGPTGLMLANWLTRLGVRCVLADHKPGPTHESRALAVQARTMEIYDQLGLADRVLAGGLQITQLAPGYRRRAFGTVRIGALGEGLTPFPGLFVFEQSKNETLLTEHLAELGGQVHWLHRLTALDSDAGGVRATLAGPDGEVTVRARYCVGTDGAGSAVRTLRGIAFDGITNDHFFYVADAAGVTGLVEDAVNIRPAPADIMLTFPMGPGGHHRVIGLVRDDGDGALTEQDVRTRLSSVFGVEYAATDWFATYRVHHRVARVFRDGPVFLAGDAAHVHSPVGAQGMNTGLQDAHNLAFKLADAVHGRAGDDWLDRYEAERRPVALRLVRSTDRVFEAVTSESAVARLVRQRAVPVVGPVIVRTIPRISGASRFFEYLSQIRVHYWLRPGSGGRRGRVVGRRLPWIGENFAPLRDLTWQVHAYGKYDKPTAQRIERELALPVHTFGGTAGTLLREGLFYLVRPDGFVAAAATAPAAVEAFRRELPINTQFVAST